MIKKIITVLVFFIGFLMYSQQEKINNYKYVIVSDKFDFLKTSDQYQTSSLTKFLLEKKGFTAFLSNDNLPEELMQNKCLAILVSVLDVSNMLTVKNKIQFKDCYGTVLYTSEIGSSKEKDYKRGYHEAIREAFNSIDNLVYTLREKPLKKEFVATVEDVIEVEVEPKKEETNFVSTTEVRELKTLYAQEITNGFQIVNTKPEVVFTLLNTSISNVFILKEKNGILYRKNNFWVAEFYKNDIKVTEYYLIKF